MFTAFRRKPVWRSFDVDAAQHGSLQRHTAGARTVPIDRIVGSVGRCNGDVPGTGLWHVSSTELRYRQIRQLLREGHALPAVELYQLDDAYYIVDGNHRVAAARSLGHVAVDAIVTEFRLIGKQDVAAVA